MRSIAASCLALWLLSGVSSRRADADEDRLDLSAALAQLDATVLAPEEPSEQREAARRMIEEDVERRLREANERSSAEWRKITNREEWERFRDAKLAALRDSLGQAAMPAPLRARVTGGLSGAGYRIENVVFQSRPGFWVTANLYRPDPARSSMPGILISHAHHTPKEHGELQDMGVTWARAGCFVLVPDHPGHGERRQHPFRSAADYARPFQVNRQDYYFRYDTGIQLHLAGESLIGWMVWDLIRGVDFLSAQEKIDPKRIILLGAVAGGGDPAAVAAALDERIVAAVPFNFGGPQPETRYPLPEDAETWFDYAGGGSWESTRNLRRSSEDGFLPWVIVGGIAPRRLVYGHEFSWDRERDPVWKRLQSIYGFYQASDHLAFTHGRGELRGQPPEATHCTHIGPPHRRLIHAAFAKWFGIEVASESTDRHPAEALRAMTPEAERELEPKKLAQILSELAADRIGQARQRRSELPLEQRRKQLQEDWSRLLGQSANPGLNLSSSLKSASRIKIKIKNENNAEETREISVERITLGIERSIVVPVIVLKPDNVGKRSAAKPAVVVMVAQAGKQRLLREHANEIAVLLHRGVAVCLPDVRGTGETSPGADGGRRSSATALSSSELMLGGTIPGAQLRDLRTVLAWLRTRDDLDARQPGLWGDSLVQANPPETNFQVPRDNNEALPRQPEPLGGLLVLLTALFEKDVQAVYIYGGLTSFASVLANRLVLIPHEAVVPGVLTVGDVGDLVAVLAPCRVRLEGTVDAWNRRVTADDFARTLRAATRTDRDDAAGAQLSFSTERTSPAEWIMAGNAGRGR